MKLNPFVGYFLIVIALIALSQVPVIGGMLSTLAFFSSDGLPIVFGALFVGILIKVVRDKKKA